MTQGKLVTGLQLVYIEKEQPGNKRSCYLTPSMPAAPSTSASHSKLSANNGNVTQCTAGIVSISNDHKGHAEREHSS